MTKSMKIYQRVYNASVGQFQMTETLVTVTFKTSVERQSALPLIGNSVYDGIIELENNHLFIWNGTEWIDQGVYDAWDDVESESIPGSTGSGDGHTHSNKSILDNIQEALTTVLKNAYDSAVSFMNSFALVGQSIGDVIRWNGSNWVPGTATNNAGAGVALYFDDNLSGVSTYKSLTSAPLSVNQINDTIVVNNNSVYFPNVYASGALGGSQIDAGEWLFDIHRWVSSGAGVTYITFEVYVRNLAGNETLLFTTTTGEINDTINTFGEIETVQPAFPINPTDVLVIKPIATTNSTNNITVNYSYDGVNNYSHVHTPLIVRHNQLAGLQGGQANEYNHLTNSQLTDVQSITDIALNVMLNAFRIAQIGSLTIFQMVKGFVDEYDDQSGIDTVNSLNQSYNSSNDFYTSEAIVDSDTQLLLHCNGTNGSTSFIDNSSYALTVTPVGDAQISTAQSKFGGASALFDGSGDYLSIVSGYALGAGDFTVDFWLNTNSIGDVYRLITTTNAGLSVNDIIIRIEGNKIRVYCGTDGVISATTITNGVWYHIAIVRSSGTVKIYIDGTADVNTVASSADLSLPILYIGGHHVVDEFFNGYLDEIRISSIARWNSNFSVPTSEYPVASNMTLISNTQVATTVPTSSRIVLFEEDIDVITINTDLKAYVSRDNGTTYSQVTLADEGNYITGARILSGVVDISSQPSGSNMKYKIETLNLKKLNLHGTAVSWK